MDAGEYKTKHWGDPEIQWVRVPTTDIPDSGGKKRWGALAGNWVRSEIWRDLNELDRLIRAGVCRTKLTQWKLHETVRSPVVHTNRIMTGIALPLTGTALEDVAGGALRRRS